MVDWRRGGWTGSVNSWVRREVRQHLRDNIATRRSRYTLIHRIFRKFFAVRTFGRFISLYFLIDVAIAVSEILFVWLAPDYLPLWAASDASQYEQLNSLVSDVSGYLITAQVGVLGVITLALALVTLIAQRENSSTDIKVYYFEAMAFEVVASSVALLAVLVAQLVWPLQSVMHHFGLGGDSLLFKFCLTGIHMGWLLINLGALAYFIATTFRFVQQSAREMLRERYTTNVIQPSEMTRLLRQQLYGQAADELLDKEVDEVTEGERPSVTFGFDFGDPRSVEIETTFDRPVALHDVRMNWVRWTVRRWSTRCLESTPKETTSRVSGLRNQGPLLCFTPQLDQSLRGTVVWCRRRGGVPLTSIEKLVLRCAFRFRRVEHEA